MEVRWAELAHLTLLERKKKLTKEVWSETEIHKLYALIYQIYSIRRCALKAL